MDRCTSSIQINTLHLQCHGCSLNNLIQINYIYIINVHIIINFKTIKTKSMICGSPLCSHSQVLTTDQDCVYHIGFYSIKLHRAKSLIHLIVSSVKLIPTG